MAVLLMRNEMGMGRVARLHIRKCGFQQKCTEIGPFKIGQYGVSDYITINFALLLLLLLSTPDLKMS